MMFRVEEPSKRFAFNSFECHGCQLPVTLIRQLPLVRDWLHGPYLILIRGAASLRRTSGLHEMKRMEVSAR